MSFETEKQLDEEYVMHTFGRKPVELVSGKGMTVTDDAGKDYLDFIAGIGVCCLGHCHPVVVEAVQKQAAKLMHVSNYYYIEQRGELSHALSDLLNTAVPEESRTPWKTFYANSGAEANECAIKLARIYSKTFGHGGQNIITLDRSFHGRTLVTLAATQQPVKQAAFQPLPGGFMHVEPNDIAALEQTFAENPNSICAVMVEPVQGESGVHPLTAEYLQTAYRLAHEHGALLICDEVQCGIYRCGGYPFAFQHFGVTADIVSMAKGIGGGFPMGACSARDEVAAAFEPGLHGSTFGGSNLAVAAATATLAELNRLDIAAHVDEMGAYLCELLATIPGVENIRGLGLMIACDLPESVDAAKVVLDALDKGLLLNYTGPHTLRFLPPLVVEKADIASMIESLTALIAAQN